MNMMEKSVWEIYVPVSDNKGVDFSIGHHKIWDKKVTESAGGLTIFKRSRGLWESQMTGKVFQERVIPVRIVCDYDTIQYIAEFTKEHYNQESVMFYLVSEKVYFV